MYKTNFKKSWSELGNNIVLLLPDLINIIFIMVLGYFLLYITGLSEILKNIPLNLNSENIQDIMPLITNNLGTIITVAIIFLVTMFFFSIAVVATKFGMIKDVMKKKKASIQNGLGYIKKFYWKIFNIKIWTFLIYLAVVVGVIIIYAILTALQLGSFATVLSILFLVVLAIIVFLSLLFKYVILFTKNSDPRKAISLSYKFFKNNNRYSLVILCMIILVALAVSMAFSILGLIPYVGEFIQSLSSFGTLVVSVWANIFLFNSYLKK
jgi:hypothetical protein